MVPERKIGLRGQLLTLAVVGLSIVAYCSPWLSDLFVYHRQAILGGEIWRLFTAPFVHFSAGHLFWDTLVFGAAGFSVSAAGFPRLWLVCCLAVFIPGILFLPAYPDLEYYGGLSGVATGAVVYYCLCSILLTDGRKRIWIVMLTVVAMKIFMEIALDRPLFVNAGTADFRVLPAAHIAGYLGAIATIMCSRRRNIISGKKKRQTQDIVPIVS
jgi:rhomboid family GlyGly-CTERM serine protease